LSFFRVVLKATKKSKTREEKKMKKLFVIFAVAVFVLFASSNPVLADDDDIISAIIAGTLTYKEYHPFISEPEIPMGSKRQAIRVDVEEAELPLYEGDYWLFDGKKIIRISTKGLIFWPLARGVYVLYTKPPITIS
jgi:hypothetical protein